MHNRKLQVIKKAHQLFIDKGFQATSIQDILDESGISKGTFYNYFSSKNELLIELFKVLYAKMEKDRDQLLIGQNPTDIDIFIKQMEWQLRANRENKLITLFEEVNFSNDQELKQFIKRGQLRSLRWMYGRFLDIFGESKKPYLLDSVISFTGMLQQHLRYYSPDGEPTVQLHEIVRYCTTRAIAMVEEVSSKKEQLHSPDQLASWLQDCQMTDQALQETIYQTIMGMKLAVNQHASQAKYSELLDFLLDELLHTKKPRKYLIESAIDSLQSEDSNENLTELQKLHQLISHYFAQSREL